MKYKTVDLCAGIGGIRRGFELAGGFKNIVSAEIDESACKTYAHIFGDNPQNDITSEEFKQSLQNLEYDVLMAGFPCQAFSSVGLKQGFEDKTKGTLFFDIAQIVKKTNPKVVFLENVQNLLSHDKKNTFRTIIEVLEYELNYHVIGLEKDDEGTIINAAKGFLRNSKNFGVPQNRPRVYIVAFSRAYYGDKLSLIEGRELPVERQRNVIYDSVNDILDDEVAINFFLSEGYLDTLERHIVKQHKKGYGFGYCIVNRNDRKTLIANSLLATGGSGKERNLIYDPEHGRKYAGKLAKGKKTPINKKYIRTMTPNEWGRLQGFVGYAFIDNEGNERFSFPEGISTAQRFKQLGNSVTIPVIEEMALFIMKQMKDMENAFKKNELELYKLYGNSFSLGKKLVSQKKYKYKDETIAQLIKFIKAFSKQEFTVKEATTFFGLTQARVGQILRQLVDLGVVTKAQRGKYVFVQL